MSFLDRRFHVRWSTLTPERVIPELTEALGLAELAITDVCRQDRGRMDFDTVFLGYERALEPLSEAWGLVGHLDAVCNNDALRTAYNAMLPKVSDFFTRLTLNDSIWDLFITYERTEEAKKLTGIQRRFMEETMTEFRQNGAELPQPKKERLAELQAELALATQKYSENVLDSTNAWELIISDPERLRGLPEVVKDAAQAEAAAKGLSTPETPAWRLTLKAPSMFPVLEHAEDDALRREVWTASGTIGRNAPYDNTDLVWQILRLRHEKATLLGHAHFPDLILQQRMAKTGATARGFITDLHARIAKPFAGETRALQEFRAEATGTPPQPLEPWETAFWSERQRKALYDFDAEELRPYFPIDGVLGGMFRLCEKLFGLIINERDSLFVEPGHEPPVGLPSAEEGGPVEVWHPEVKFYEIRDADGSHLGSFYADWHPRDSKRGGAWMNYLKTGHPDRADQPRTPHLGLMCGNMTPSTPGQPSLLTHDEVETVFHEFGHLLHHLLGNVEIKSLNGVNVAWDFVELPSQLMENFCWERESLDFFARHHQTDEPIPPRLYKKMLAAKNYQSALATMRQLSLGKLDLDLHLTSPHPQGRTLDEVAEDILEGYLMPLKTRPPTMARRFTHLFADPTGYAAGYYSYKWAEVLEADAFSRFKADGVLSEKVGRDYRERLLSRGNSADPAQLFRDFMGRDPDSEALLRRSGLA